MKQRAYVDLAAISAFALLCVAGLGYLAVSLGLELPGVREGWRLEASFAAVDGLAPQAEVHVSGVHVGRVVSIGPDGTGGAVVTMVIDRGVELRQDTRAVVRPRSVLGEQEIDLVRRQGSTAPFAGDGFRLPRAQTGQAVQLDDILNKMDATTRAATQTSLRELGVAVTGQEGDISASLPEVEQVAANLRPLAQVADARQREIAEILTDLAVILKALADEQDALSQAINSGDTATAAIAQRDQDLAGTVQQADRLFTSLDTALAGATPADRSTLAEAPGTIKSGRQLEATLGPAVDRLLPELLLAQVAYPNNQLSVSQSDAATLASEWISAFSQTDSLGHAMRITGIVDPATAVRQPALPATVTGGTGGAPAAAGASVPGGGAVAQVTQTAQGLVPSAVQLLLGLAP